MKNNSIRFNWKNVLLRNWNFIRVVRLVLAIALLFEGFRSGEEFFAVVGGLFFIQSVLNLGCCGSTACSTNQEKSNLSDIDETITYEEIKGGK